MKVVSETEGRCPRCKLVLPLSEFWEARTYCKVCSVALTRAQRRKNPAASRAASLRNHYRNRDAKLKKAKERRHRIRERILSERGWQCECCKASYPWTIAFELDHVNNDGHLDRLTTEGLAAWKKWRDSGYPSNLQVLCIQCNQMKARNGGVCPHQEILDSSTG